MFKKGDEVETVRTIFGTSGASLLQRGRKGVVSVVGGRGVLRADFKVFGQLRKVWFLIDLQAQDNGYTYKAYPPVSLLRLIEPTKEEKRGQLEGATFTVLEDKGDGTYLVRKD